MEKNKERHSSHGAARCRGRQQVQKKAGVKAPEFLGKTQAETGHQENFPLQEAGTIPHGCLEELGITTLGGLLGLAGQSHSQPDLG